MADIIDFRVKNGLLVTTTATIEGATQSTSSTTGALVVTGGAGIRKDLYVGGAIYGNPVYSNNGLVLTTATLAQYGVSSITAGTDTAINTSTGAVTIWGTSTLQSVTSRGATTNQALTLTNATTSTTTATGALVVTAGVGIGGNLNVGGNVTIGGSITGSITTATHLAGGTVGQVPYQTAVGRTAFTGPGTLGNLFVSGGAAAPGYLATGVSGTILTSAGSGSNPSWNNTLTLDGITESTSTATGTLQVRGGVGINRSVWIGQRLNVVGDAIITGDVTVNGGDIETSQTTFNLINTTATTVSFAGAGTLITIGASGSGSTTVRNRFTVTDTTNATSTVTGAVSVRGGASVGQDVYVGGVVDILGTAASTSTITANALYVAGGVGIGSSLYVQGKAYFQDDVIFSGTSTYVYSTQTLYTDNLINLHVPSGSSGTSHTWTVDDGKDIGHVFHYYTGTDRDAFLGLATGSKFLEWWSNGTETNGVYTGSTWGTFKTGSIILTDTTASTTTATGALQVAGGVGIGGSMFVGGNVTVLGTINASVTGIITTATNLANGAAGQVPYQTGVGLTGFTSAGTAGTILTSNGTGAPTWNNTLTLAGTTSATSTLTGVLQVRGGVGIGGDLISGGYGRFNGAYDETASTSTIALYLGVGGSAPVSPRVGFANSGTTWQIDNYNGNFRWYTPGTVRMQLDTIGALTVYSSTASTSTATGAITTPGGAGIGGSLFVGGNTNVTGNVIATGDVSINGGDLQTNQTTFNLLNTTATTINFGGASTTMTVGSNAAGYVLIQNNSDATSTATGALRVNGGVGVNRDIWVGQRLNVGSDAIITGDVSVNGGDLLTNQTTFNLLNTTATTINFGGAGTNITVGATTGTTTVRNDTTLTSITAATTTATGALQVRGGVGIGGALIVGGAGNIGGDLTLAADLNVNGGDLATNQTTFNLINTTATTINFGGAGTNITIGATTGATTVRNNTTVTSTTAASSTATGAFQVRGGVGIGGDLYVGGTINGTAATAGNANTVRTTATSTASNYYLTFVDSDNATAAYEAVYTDAGIQYNPSSNDLLLAGDLQVQGGDLTTNQTTFNLLNSTATTINFGGASTAMTIGANAAGTVTIRNNTDATSTATGSLVVYGGVGINRSVYIGGNNNVAGNEIVTGDVSINGGDLQTNQTTFNLLNTTATTINFGGASTVMSVGAASAGYVQIKNNSAASSTATGALRVDGGVGVNGAVYAGNIFSNGSQVIPFKMEEFTATGGQTTFTVTGGYVVGTVMVFANGIFLNSGDFTASNGTTVVLNFARNAGDIIKVVAGGTSSAANQSQAFSVAMSVALSM